MKKSGIIFFEFSFIILLFACTADTTAIKTYEVGEKGVHVAWNSAAKPPDTPEDSEIRYCLYISKSEPNDKKEAVTVTKFFNNDEFDAATPIADTSCIIKIPPTGDEFVIGVQTVVYLKENPVVCDATKFDEYHSQIAWSDKEISTNYHPFAVHYGEY